MRPGRAADHSPPYSAAVMEEYSYTSAHPLGHTGLVTRTLYIYVLHFIHIGNGFFLTTLTYRPYFKFIQNFLEFILTMHADRRLFRGKLI